MLYKSAYSHRTNNSCKNINKGLVKKERAQRPFFPFDDMSCSLFDHDEYTPASTCMQEILLLTSMLFC
jgi:hypothetical protein